MLLNQQGTQEQFFSQTAHYNRYCDKAINALCRSCIRANIRIKCNKRYLYSWQLLNNITLTSNVAVNNFSPSDQLINFCKLVDESNDLQSQVKESTTDKQIIEIAASNGYEISYKELRIWSTYLKASYFPWSEKGNEWRRNFFS